MRKIIDDPVLSEENYSYIPVSLPEDSKFRVRTLIGGGSIIDLCPCYQEMVTGGI